MRKKRKSLFAIITVLLGVWAVPVFGLDGPQPGSLKPSTLTLPSGPASIRGLAKDPSVSVFSGQVSYEIPLELPKSGGKFSPTMSLSYDGSQGNGPIGLGWGIEFPRIERSLRLGVPGYDDEDEFDLVGLGDNGRIRPLGDGTYRVEGAGNDVRIQRYGNMFFVTDENGIRYYMGLNQTGRKESGDGRTVQWLTQMIIHPTGQRVSLAYQTEQSETYLASVHWGPRNVFEAKLNYVTRPDVVTSYRTGYKVVTSFRLSDIQIKAYGQALRTYHMEYDDSFQLSRLIKVRMTGRTEQDEMPSIQLTYNTPAPSSASVLEGGDGLTPSVPDVALADIDSDGMADLLHLTPGNHSYYRNLGGYLGPRADLPGAEGASLTSGMAVLLDMNGDGRTELVRNSTENWEVYDLGAGGFSDARFWMGTESVPVTGNNIVFADINGDGRADMIERIGAGYNVRMNGDGGIDEPEYFASFDGRVLTDELQLRFQDANGDDLADAIRVSTTGAEVWPGVGDGHFDFPYVVSFPFEEINLSNIWFADLDRDGTIDVVHVEDGHVAFYPSFTDGALAEAVVLERPDDLSRSARVNVADINGNGSMDIVWSTTEGMWYLDLAGAATAGMLTRVENGMGKKMDFQYRASAILALEDELAGDAWFEKLPISIPVATQVETELASGDPRRTVLYAVQDGFYDGEERRFGGFQVGTTTYLGSTPADTLIETKHFHDGLGEERVLRGKPYRTETRDGDGKLYAITIDQWDVLKLENYPDDPLLRAAALKRRFSLKYEGDSRPVYAHSYFVYDGSGRIVREYDYGRADIKGDEVYTSKVYADNDSTWVRNKIIEKKVTSADGKITEWKRNYYDGNSLPLDHGTVTKGWLRKVEAYLHSDPSSDTDGEFVTISETDYDKFGNPVRIFEKGTEREIVYDADGIYPVTEHQAPSEDRAIVWNMTWDPVVGKPLTLVDPNGVEQSWTYDGLGRLKTVALDGVTYKRHSYKWSAPTPTQTTVTFDDDINGDGVFNSLDIRVAVAVSNSAGEPLYNAAALESGRWILEKGKRYDARGKAKFIANAAYYSGTALPDQLPEESVGEILTYDAKGRQILQELPSGALKSTVYGPYTKEITTEGLAPVRYDFDGQDRIIKTTRFIPGSTETTTARYDSGDRLLEISLQQGQVVHQYNYDTMGRLMNATDPDVGWRSYEYDEAGRVLSAENGEDEIVQYDYDLTGRLTRISGDVQAPVVIHYDQPETIEDVQNHTVGRPAWIEDGEDLLSFSYDKLGRTAGTSRTIAGVTATESSSFTPSGLMMQKHYDDGFTVDYQYDRAGRINAIGDFWVAEELDPNGRVLEERYGNHVRQEYVRNSLGLPETIQISSGSTSLVSLALSFNPMGAVTQIEDLDGTGLDHSASYVYDGGARLRQAEIANMIFDYEYDELQNIIARSQTFVGPIEESSTSQPLQEMLQGVYRHGENGRGPRQLASVGDTVFSYDQAGRMVHDGERTLHYDGLDRMTQVDDPSKGSIYYRYGYDGKRTLSRYEGGEQEILFGDNLKYSNGIRSHYIHLDDRVLARVDLQSNEGDWTERGRVYYHRGSSHGAILLTDDKGGVVDERRYEPFGAVIDADYAVGHYGPGGKPIDLQTGFADHGVRWYASRHGHWMTPDPPAKKPDKRYIEAPWDLNPYWFVRQNPNFYNDPDGRNPQRKADIKIVRNVVWSAHSVASQLVKNPMGPIQYHVVNGGSTALTAFELTTGVLGIGAGSTAVTIASLVAAPVGVALLLSSIGAQGLAAKANRQKRVFVRHYMKGLEAALAADTQGPRAKKHYAYYYNHLDKAGKKAFAAGWYYMKSMDRKQRQAQGEAIKREYRRTTVGCLGTKCSVSVQTGGTGAWELRNGRYKP